VNTIEQIGKFVSADGHVHEPEDLWLTRMDQRFRSRAPQVERREDADYFRIEGLEPFALTDLVGAMANEKAEGSEIRNRSHNREAQMRPGAIDPNARLLDQDLDNLRAEVCYPNRALFLFGISDPDYRRECFRVYNDWLAEYCSVAPNRLVGVGLLPVGGPIQWAIAEAERIARLGLRSVMMPSGSPKGGYGDSYYKPLWSALEEIGMPVAFHTSATDDPNANISAISTRAGGALAGFIELKYITHIRTVVSLVGSGIPQAYPRMRFVIVEGGIGWVAAVTRSMDHWWQDHHHWMRPRLEQPPSSYLHRQFYFTFEDDRAGILTRPMLNLEHLMWGSDYPHTEGTFPHSREQVSADFAGLPAEDVRRLVVDNAVQLYGI
jgi:uncharacterized protein